MYTYGVYRKDNFLFWIQSEVPICRGDKILLEDEKETKLKVVSIKHSATIISREGKDVRCASTSRLYVR